MAADPSQDAQLADLKKQVEILQQQLAVVTAQAALDKAQQTQDAVLSKAITDAMKEKAASQFAAESEQAKLPLAELSGVKSALGNMQLPGGKSGTIQLAAGTTGTALLRSKEPMLTLLDSVASDLSTLFPNGAVLVTAAQIDQASQAAFTIARVIDQTNNLKEAITRATPQQPVAQPLFLPQFAAGAYALGFSLDTVNSLAKLFRTDRKLDIFSSDAEPAQMLGYLLEKKNAKFVADPTIARGQINIEAKKLLDALNGLSLEVQRANAVLAQVKKIEEEEAKTKPASSRLPAATSVDVLKAQVEASTSLLDGLHPSKKMDAFWTQVKGLLLGSVMTDQELLLLEVKAQAIQITESRWYAGDKLIFSGEVQAAYRSFDKNGVKKAGVILKATQPTGKKYTNLKALSFPQ